MRSHDPCVWCQRMPSEVKDDNIGNHKPMTIDHLWPKGSRGRNMFAHYGTVASCYQCNHRRGSMSMLAFLVRIGRRAAKRGGPRQGSRPVPSVSSVAGPSSGGSGF